MPVRIFLRCLLILVLVAAAGCGGLILKMYGMKKLRAVNAAEVNRYARQYGINEDQHYVLDTAYWGFIRSIDTTKYSAAQKNHAQPLQALYFNQQGELISWHINCYTGGFPNLKWERDSAFAVFPPKQQAPLDSLLSLQQLGQYVITPEDSLQIVPLPVEYTVVVFWNRWMGRQSERLIHLVQENAALGKKKQVKIIYVNNDNFWSTAEHK